MNIQTGPTPQPRGGHDGRLGQPAVAVEGRHAEDSRAGRRTGRVGGSGNGRRAAAGPAARRHSGEQPARQHRRSWRPPIRCTERENLGWWECLSALNHAKVRTRQECLAGVSEGGLEPPHPIRALAPQASASAIPPLGRRATHGHAARLLYTPPPGVRTVVASASASRSPAAADRAMAAPRASAARADPPASTPQHLDPGTGHQTGRATNPGRPGGVRRACLRMLGHRPRGAAPSIR